MGICCNYSPSMRLGKPRKNRNPDGTIMRDVSPATSRGPMAPRLDMIPRTSAYTSESSPEPTDSFFYGPATPEYHYPDAFMARFEGSRSPSYSNAGSLVNGWSDDDQLMYGSPADMYAPVPQFPPAHPPFAGHVRSTSVQSQPEMFTQMEGLNSSPLSSPPYFMADHPPSYYARSSSDATCFCDFPKPRLYTVRLPNTEQLVRATILPGFDKHIQRRSKRPANSRRGSLHQQKRCGQAVCFARLPLFSKSTLFDHHRLHRC
jgi:hypothetical protein